MQSGDALVAYYAGKKCQQHYRRRWWRQPCNNCMYRLPFDTEPCWRWFIGDIVRCAPRSSKGRKESALSVGPTFFEYTGEVGWEENILDGLSCQLWSLILSFSKSNKQGISLLECLLGLG